MFTDFFGLDLTFIHLKSCFEQILSNSWHPGYAITLINLNPGSRIFSDFLVIFWYFMDYLSLACLIPSNLDNID